MSGGVLRERRAIPSDPRHRDQQLRLARRGRSRGSLYGHISDPCSIQLEPVQRALRSGSNLDSQQQRPPKVALEFGSPETARANPASALEATPARNSSRLSDGSTVLVLVRAEGVK